MRFQAVERLAGEYPVQRLCHILGAGRSGYYRWRKREETHRVREDRRLKREILATHGETKQRYGSPRIERELRRRGTCTSRWQVGRLRRELELRAKVAKEFKATTDSRYPYPVAPNRLERRFEATAADRIWVDDITYLWTRGDWLYLAIILTGLGAEPEVSEHDGVVTACAAGLEADLKGGVVGREGEFVWIVLVEREPSAAPARPDDLQPSHLSPRGTGGAGASQSIRPCRGAQS